MDCVWCTAGCGQHAAEPPKVLRRSYESHCVVRSSPSVRCQGIARKPTDNLRTAWLTSSAAGDSLHVREGRHMKLKYVLGVSVAAAGLGFSPIVVGQGVASAAPPAPCNPPVCQPGGPAAPPQGGPHEGGPPQGGPQGGPQGHPGDLPPDQFRAPGQGAPPPPRFGENGWNDGPPPGGPPRGWNGPPPPGGWNGPPPPGGWNRNWDGPPRDIDQARFDHQPFNYNGYQAVPIFNPDFNGWGFWFFGLWIPL
jgi:hypothetical protein